jgi:hypothetical protein
MSTEDGGFAVVCDTHMYPCVTLFAPFVCACALWALLLGARSRLWLGLAWLGLGWLGSLTLLGLTFHPLSPRLATPLVVIMTTSYSSV